MQHSAQSTSNPVTSTSASDKIDLCKEEFSPTNSSTAVKEMVIEALQTGNYEGFGRAFKTDRWMNTDGVSALAGIYTARRAGQNGAGIPSGFIGNLVPVYSSFEQDLSNAICSGYPLRGKLEKFAAIDPIVKWGTFGGEEGESFFPPTLWSWDDAGQGRAILDLDNIYQKLAKQGVQCLSTILAPRAREITLSLIDDEKAFKRCIAHEYLFHELGHSSGIGIDRKVALGLCSGELGVYEEWRADAMEAHLGHRQRRK
jgi:hypothetical protein